MIKRHKGFNISLTSWDSKYTFTTVNNHQKVQVEKFKVFLLLQGLSLRPSSYHFLPPHFLIMQNNVYSISTIVFTIVIIFPPKFSTSNNIAKDGDKKYVVCETVLNHILSSFLLIICVNHAHKRVNSIYWNEMLYWLFTYTNKVTANKFTCIHALLPLPFTSPWSICGGFEDTMALTGVLSNV